MERNNIDDIVRLSHLLKRAASMIGKGNYSMIDIILDAAGLEPLGNSHRNLESEIDHLRSWMFQQSFGDLVRLLETADQPLTSSADSFALRQRKRLGMPLIILSNGGEETVMACPDSGSDDNIMSRRIADKLGLPIMSVRDPTPPTFVIANGRTVSAVGRVRVKCAFGQGSQASSPLDCVFYVFQTLAVPMIMGASFLQATETLTKYRNRLVEELVPASRPLRVCNVGRLKRDVVCRVGTHVGCATADTGSDLDLVSTKFAASRSFDVESLRVELEFADGSTGYTLGMIKTAFSIGRVNEVGGFTPRSQERSLEMFVLDNMNADILMSADTTQELQAFSGHKDCFIPAIPRLGESSLNIIRYIKNRSDRISLTSYFEISSKIELGLDPHRFQADTLSYHHQPYHKSPSPLERAFARRHRSPAAYITGPLVPPLHQSTSTPPFDVGKIHTR